MGGGDGDVVSFLTVLIGSEYHDMWVWNAPITKGDVRLLDHETGSLPVAVCAPKFNTSDFAVNIEIECELEEWPSVAWQIKSYQAIVEAYDNLKAEADNKMSEWDPNLPGLSPTRKSDLIKTELKKGALSKMFRCNPFWITDNYEVGKEYDPDCCADSLNAEKVRFLETVFDWNNTT